MNFLTSLMLFYHWYFITARHHCG